MSLPPHYTPGRYRVASQTSWSHVVLAPSGARAAGIDPFTTRSAAQAKADALNDQRTALAAGIKRK